MLWDSALLAAMIMQNGQQAGALCEGTDLDGQGGNDGLGMHQAGVTKVVQACNRCNNQQGHKRCNVYSSVLDLQHVLIVNQQLSVVTTKSC